jgi:hypothetical protein
MKTNIIHLLAALIFLSGSGIEIALAETQHSPDISAIRQRYVAINRNLAKYKQVKKDLEGYSTEGGELIAYLDGEDIVKLVANFYGESGKAVEEYYYRESQLIFVYRKDSSYDKPLSGRIVQVETQRFYFKNGRMVRWINEKGKNVIAGEEYSKKQEEYLTSSQEFTNGARSPNAVIEARND